jgi:hypothetical protein
MIFSILLVFPGLCNCLVSDFLFSYLRSILVIDTTYLSSCFSLCNSLTPINICFQYCSWYLDRCTPKFTHTFIVVLCQHLTVRLTHTLSLISSLVQDFVSFIVCFTGLILFSWLYICLGQFYRIVTVQSNFLSSRICNSSLLDMLTVVA